MEQIVLPVAVEDALTIVKVLVLDHAWIHVQNHVLIHALQHVSNTVL